MARKKAESSNRERVNAYCLTSIKVVGLVCPQRREKRYEKIVGKNMDLFVPGDQIQEFLHTLWEFTGGKDDKDNFIQKALKVCKIFKIKPLKIPKPDVPSKKTACNLFCKDILKIRKEVQGVPVFKASGIISKEWKRVKASDKKMKKYKDLYEEEKQRHKEALQRYQKDHMDEMEIISFHRRCNKKARKTPQPKNTTKSDDSSKEGQKPQKASRSSDAKKTTTKAGKKVKKASRPKKASKSPEFIDSSEEMKGCLRVIKSLLCWG